MGKLTVTFYMSMSSNATVDDQHVLFKVKVSQVDSAVL